MWQMCTRSYQFSYRSCFLSFLSKHIQKGCAEEFVGEFDGALALFANGVGLVRNGGDAFLFGRSGTFHSLTTFVLTTVCAEPTRCCNTFVAPQVIAK